MVFSRYSVNIDIIGIAKKTPNIPNNEPKTKIEKMTTTGCNPNFFPIIFGVNILLSSKCAKEKISKTYNM